MRADGGHVLQPQTKSRGHMYEYDFTLDRTYFRSRSRLLLIDLWTNPWLVTSMLHNITGSHLHERHSLAHLGRVDSQLQIQMMISTYTYTYTVIANDAFIHQQSLQKVSNPRVQRCGTRSAVGSAIGNTQPEQKSSTTILTWRQSRQSKSTNPERIRF